MTSISGAVVWSATYSSFGKAVVDADSTVENNFRFPGQYCDIETGLHYNWHRYYDPDTGRYLTPDPIGLEGGINLFVYTFNNPINRIDPTGLDSPGCDVVGGFDFFSTPCMLECCALHDECYDKYQCSASSWVDDPCISQKNRDCNKCNVDVENCMAKCRVSKTTNNYDDPNRPNYYCAKLHKYIKIPGDFPDIQTAIKACKTN